MGDYEDKKVRPLSERRIKTAGEVRFIKDRGDDSTAWAWGQHNPQERTMMMDYKYNKKCAKSLAKVLRSSLMALGHSMSAYAVFTKIKSRDVSPDGNLGGRGYIMEIKNMRRQYMNVVEALSALSDTIYDEINADHWEAAQQKIVKQILEQAESVMEDPEEWAMDLEEEIDEQAEEEAKITPKPPGKGKEPPKLERDLISPRTNKTASFNQTMARSIADRYMRGMR